MRRFQGVAYAGLLLILALYMEEAVHYAFHRQAEMIFPLFTSACQPIADEPGFAWCNVSGYGRTRFQRSLDSYSYVDPSSPKLTWDEINERNRIYKQMFGSEESTPSTVRPASR